MLLWYLVPYERQDRSPTRPTRGCRLRPKTVAAHGGVMLPPVEVLGDHGLVAVDGPSACHAAITETALPAVELTQPIAEVVEAPGRQTLLEYVRMLGYALGDVMPKLVGWEAGTTRMSTLLNVMRARRLKPRYDGGTDTVVLDGPVQPCRPLPFDAQALFPAVDIIDTFNRTNENPLANSTWSGPTWAGDAEGQLLTNVATSAGASWGGSYISTPGAYAADQHVFATVAGLDAGPTNRRIILYTRLQNPGGSGTMDGYMTTFTNDANLDLSRIDNNVETVLVNDFAHNSADGDKVGVAHVGTTYEAWTDTGTGWTLRTSTTDATYNLSGHIGFETITNAVTVDDFGAGAAAAVPIFYSHQLMEMNA